MNVLLLLTTIVISGCGGGGDSSKPPGPDPKPKPVPTATWVKGNLHTHTTNSDGDSSPSEVAEWYEDHGYQFLAITDHDQVTDPSTAGNTKLLLIPGMELSISEVDREVEMNVINASSDIVADRQDNVATALRLNLDIVRAKGAIPLINHPNNNYRVGLRDMMGLHGPFLLEIHNGAPGSNNNGGGSHPSAEEMWDSLLSAGKTVYGVADDDAHKFNVFDEDLNNPGRGWIMVLVSTLSQQEVLSSIQKGDFYCSTGVEFKTLEFKDNKLSVEVKPASGEHYTIHFIGHGGKVLYKKRATRAEYSLKLSTSDYVRVRVTSDSDHKAWSQAFRKS